MRLLILTRYDRLGASSRLRMLQYVEHLEHHGVSCTVSPLLSDRYLERLYESGTRSISALIVAYTRRAAKLLSVRRYDKLWIEKELFPRLPATVERLLARFGVRYVVDCDDAVFHNYDLSESWIVRRLLGSKIDVVMANAETVTAGNAYIASRARKAGSRNVRIVPTVVDHRRYQQLPPPPTRRPTIGWIGSPATQSFILDVAETLISVCRKHNARLLLVGAQPSVMQRFADIDVEVRPWSEKTERDDIADMDIGIMPLQDKPWERGKCGYKLIQYMASGVAVCASPVGVNVDIVERSGAGLLAGDHGEWQAALEKLILDVEARRAMEARGRLAVVTAYSVESQLPALLDILRK
jgi:glycosyltransferase involved in cell wall biosynthesis